MNNVTRALGSLLLLAICFLGHSSCHSSARKIEVEIGNELALSRSNEIVEIPMAEVIKRLHLVESDSIVILNSQQQEVPYQVTYDNKLIFPVQVAASSTVCYTIQGGIPTKVDTIACGKYYAERLDDISWENDVTAFRAYGPGSEELGYKLYGYDVFTKNNTPLPVVEKRYALDLDSTRRAEIKELQKSNPEAAKELARAISYHVDHGNGMDCYAVGPTLGGGACALVVNDTLLYPRYYQNYAILDNGPLRFTLQLSFPPVVVGADSAVIEHRLITLDAGSYLNKTAIVYEALTQNSSIATGIVLHDRKENVTCNDAEGFISYVDPTQGDDNGVMFMGVLFPTSIDRTEVSYFSPEEKEARDGAEGHVLAFSSYTPLATHTYYWGSAWSRGKIENAAQWNSYLSLYSKCLQQPLRIRLK